VIDLEFVSGPATKAFVIVTFFNELSDTAPGIEATDGLSYGLTVIATVSGLVAGFLVSANLTAAVVAE
jgi:hypothetical protein